MASGLHGQFAQFTYNAIPITGITEISDVGVGDSATVDTTAMGDQATSALKGVPSGGTIKVSGYAPAGTTDHCALATRAQSAASAAFTYFPEGTGTGKGKITGTAYCTSYVQSAAFGGAIQWTAQFAVTGAVVFGVQ